MPDKTPDEDLRRLARRLLCLPDGWDLPPELGLVYAPDGPGERIRSKATSLPADLWEVLRPHEVLGRLTAALTPNTGSGATLAGYLKTDDPATWDVHQNGPEAIQRAFAGFVQHMPGWCGVYLLHEAYTAPEDMGFELLRRDEVGEPVGNFADMPGSEEVRILNVALTQPLVDFDDVFMGRLRRSDNKVVLAGDVPALAESIGGRVPDALLGLLAALKSLTQAQPGKGRA